jgi:purine-binding chemotaxis protein CheW
MRPLPIEPIPGAPDFVSGVAIVRGAPLPVVNATRLLGGPLTMQAGRFVTLRAGERRVVLAVDAVLGIRELRAGSTYELPLLLRDAAADVIATIGALDAQLLLVLRTMHLVPESVFQRLAMKGAS